MNKAIAICTVAGLSLLASGCAVRTDDYNRMVHRVRQEQEVNDHLRVEYEKTLRQLAETEETAFKWQSAYGELENAQKELLEVTNSKPEPAVDSELADLIGDLTTTVKHDFEGTTFNVVEASHAVGVRLDDGAELLFHTGSWTLTGNAKKNIDELADIVKKTLQENPEYIVRIDGHTDVDPINKLKKQGIKSNAHLGFMRAHAVYEAFIDKGIPAEKLTVMSAGQYLPVSTKKNLNRRVEVWVSTPEGFSISEQKTASGTVKK